MALRTHVEPQSVHLCVSRIQQKIKGILNQSRNAHTTAVQGRIDSVGEMKDVVSITEQLFALSKETAQIEHEAFVLRQKAGLAGEIKSTLDSWVRYESQLRDSEQADLVKSIQEKVLASLKDSKTQKDILGQAVADVEGGHARAGNPLLFSCC